MTCKRLVIFILNSKFETYLFTNIFKNTASEGVAGQLRARTLNEFCLKLNIKYIYRLKKLRNKFIARCALVF